MKKLLFYASAVAVLFSSCSKDATEDIAVQAGHEVFTASINIEDENQTRLHLEGAEYIWDVNDAIGVSSATVANANIPVTASKAGSVPSFVVSKNDYDRWLYAVEKDEDNPLYVYFPYQDGKVFDEDGNIELTVPKTQRYEANSFFRNEVPAVGYAAAWNDAGQNIELKVPVALLRVNVFGWGELEAIKLTIQNSEGEYYTLSGSANVNVAPVEGKEYAPALTLKAGDNEAPANDVKDYVEVVFGKKIAEEIAYNTTLPVHFILPAGINLSEATLTFIPKFKGADDYDMSEAFVKKMATESSAGKMDLRPNLRVTIGDNISFGLKDKFLVMDDENYTAEEKFLAYAYFAQTQTNNTEAELKKMTEHFNTVADILGVTAAEAMKMQALLIDTELDFAAYDKAWAEAEFKVLDDILVFDPIDDFWKDVYTWYIANGGAIESLAYNAVVGVENTTIKNLNVAGTGLTVAADLENLTFENTTVVAPKSANMVGFLAPKSFIGEMSISDVAISTGNKVVAKEATYVGGIYGNADAGKNDIKTAEAIAIEAENCKYVGRLYGYLDTPFTLALEGYKWDPSVATTPVVGLLKNKANLTADVAVNNDLINGGIVGHVEVAVDRMTGSVLVGDTYYWNGGKCATNYDGSAYDKDGKVTNPLTAEELATALAEGISDYDIVFTHNIDMQGDHMIFSDDDVDPMAIYPFVLAIEKDNYAYNFVVDGKEKTLANVNLTHKGVITNVTLFGANSTIEDLTVSGLTINAAAEQTNNVAGLANTGKAKNVTVNNVAINVTGEAWYDKKATNHTIGAVFVSVNAKDIENVTANNVAIVSGAKASAGLVAGKLVLSGETSELNKIVVTGSNSVAVKDVKSMTVKTAAKLESYKAGTNYAFNAPFGIVNPENAQFSAGGQVNHTLTVKDCSYGDKLAAGYWITLKKPTSVALSKTAYPSTGYGYVFASNANAGNSEPYNNIAFTK